jgi:hypothetical protein
MRSYLFFTYIFSITFSKFDIPWSIFDIQKIWIGACDAKLLVLYLYLLFHLFQIRYSLVDIRYSKNLNRHMRCEATCSLLISPLSSFPNSIFFGRYSIFKESEWTHTMNSYLFFTYIFSINFSKFDIPWSIFDVQKI